jgi:hypothetical protein
MFLSPMTLRTWSENPIHQLLFSPCKEGEASATASFGPFIAKCMPVSVVLTFSLTSITQSGAGIDGASDHEARDRAVPAAFAFMSFTSFLVMFLGPERAEQWAIGWCPEREQRSYCSGAWTGDYACSSAPPIPLGCVRIITANYPA